MPVHSCELVGLLGAEAHTSRCFSVRMLTQNTPLASMACHEQDTLVGQNSTSGGSSESAAKDWQAKPLGTLS